MPGKFTRACACSLEQGRLAESLGYAENAATERAATLIFQLRFSVGSGDTALVGVRELVRASGVSYFTRRNGLLELSSAHALRVEQSLARRALDEAQRIALMGSVGHPFERRSSWPERSGARAGIQVFD